jgi:hypothetical protein
MSKYRRTRKQVIKLLEKDYDTCWDEDDPSQTPMEVEWNRGFESGLHWAIHVLKEKKRES